MKRFLKTQTNIVNDKICNHEECNNEAEHRVIGGRMEVAVCDDHFALAQDQVLQAMEELYEMPEIILQDGEEKIFHNTDCGCPECVRTQKLLGR